MEIALLAAEGLNNREIGERLYISTNTVKTALKGVFEKLNVNSRALLKQSLEKLN
jgi:LuxR family maltose regulon positive regulatory protein